MSASRSVYFKDYAYFPALLICYKYHSWYTKQHTHWAWMILNYPVSFRMFPIFEAHVWSWVHACLSYIFVSSLSKKFYPLLLNAKRLKAIHIELVIRMIRIGGTNTFIYATIILAMCPFDHFAFEIILKNFEVWSPWWVIFFVDWKYSMVYDRFGCWWLVPRLKPVDLKPMAIDLLCLYQMYQYSIISSMYFTMDMNMYANV